MPYHHESTSPRSSMPAQSTFLGRPSSVKPQMDHHRDWCVWPQLGVVPLSLPQKHPHQCVWRHFQHPELQLWIQLDNAKRKQELCGFQHSEGVEHTGGKTEEADATCIFGCRDVDCWIITWIYLLKILHLTWREIWILLCSADIIKDGWLLNSKRV